MRPSHAVTPITLVVLAGTAVAYAYLVDRGTVSDADRAERRRDVFPTFRVDEVKRIEVVGSDDLVLTRGADAGWAMTSPRQETADPATVDVLLREFELATRLRDVRPDEAPGLSEPRVHGRLSVGPIEYSFALGADAPIPRDAAYMSVEGEGAFVVGSALKVQLLRSADAYRDRTLVPYGPSDVAQLEFRSGEDSYTLERVGSSFRVGAANGLRASRQGVEALFAAVADLRAEAFVGESQAAEAMPPDAATVTITPREAASPRVVLRVGGDCPSMPDGRLVARTEPTRKAACVPRRAVEGLRVSRDALVDTAVFFAHADEIEEARIEPVAGPGPRVDVARAGSGWRERAPEVRDLAGDDADAVSALVAAFADAKAIDARRDGEGGASVDRVTIFRTGGTASEVIDVGAPGADGTAFARRSDDGAILRLSHAVTRRLEPHPVIFRRRALWDPPFSGSRVIGIDDTCGPTPQHAKLTSGTWTFQTPGSLAVDAVAVEGLADAVARAKADSWIAESDDGSFGFGGPASCTLSVSLGDDEGGPTRRVGIDFGAAGEGGTYARVAGVGGRAVAVLPPTLVELASRPAIDGAPLKVDLQSLAQVVVQHDATRVQLSRSGEEFVRTPPIDREGGATSPSLEGAIAELSALFAIHAGAAKAEEGFAHPTLVIDETVRLAGGQRAETVVTIGAEARVGDTDVYCARVSGIDATFAVSHKVADAIASAL